jgi:integrase/recombinase XerD
MTTLLLAPGTIASITDRPLLDQAIIGLLSRCKTAGTLKEYTRDLAMFLDWCQRETIDPMTARRPMIELYVRQMQNDPRGYAEATINRRVGTMRLFFKYASMDELIDRDPSLAVDRPKVDWRKQHRTWLSAVEFASFLTAARSEGKTATAMTMTMGVAGLRVAEMCSLNVSSLTIEPGYETVRFIGKGNHAAVMRLEQPVARAIRECIGDREVGPIFVNQWGNRMDRAASARLIAKIAKAAGVREDITPHSLRRTVATTLLDLGESIYEVQGLLRHADPKTTARYDQKFDQRGGQASGRIASFVSTLAS